MENSDNNKNFFKNHADTIAIIGVNIGIAAIIIMMWLANCDRIDLANSRIDTLHVMFYDLLKEGKGR